MLTLPATYLVCYPCSVGAHDSCRGNCACARCEEDLKQELEEESDANTRCDELEQEMEEERCLKDRV